MTKDITQLNVAEEVKRIEDKAMQFYPGRELPLMWVCENDSLEKSNMLDKGIAQLLFACGYREAIEILSDGQGSWEFNKMASHLGLDVNYGVIADGYIKLFDQIVIYSEDTKEVKQNKEHWAREWLKKALEAVETAERLKQPEWKYYKAEIYRRIDDRDEAKKLYKEAYEERLPYGSYGVDVLFAFHQQENPRLYGKPGDIIDKLGDSDGFGIKLIIAFVLVLFYPPLVLAFFAFWIFAKVVYVKREKNPFRRRDIDRHPEVAETSVRRWIRGRDFPEHLYPSSPFVPKEYDFTYETEVVDGSRYDQRTQQVVDTYRKTVEFASGMYDRAMARYNRKKMVWYAELIEIVREERIKNWEKLRKEADAGRADAQYLMTVFGFSMDGHNDGVPVFTTQEEYIMSGYNLIAFFAPEE